MVIVSESACLRAPKVTCLTFMNFLKRKDINYYYHVILIKGEILCVVWSCLIRSTWSSRNRHSLSDTSVWGKFLSSVFLGLLRVASQAFRDFDPTSLPPTPVSCVDYLFHYPPLTTCMFPSCSRGAVTTTPPSRRHTGLSNETDCGRVNHIRYITVAMSDDNNQEASP